jgi:alpha-beta hydrolase superfamily lysophospholipase
MAYLHARAMTHFDPSGARTPRPEQLRAWGKIRVVFTGIHVPRPRNVSTPATRGWTYETHHFTTSDGVNLEAWYMQAKQQPSRGCVEMFHGYISAKSALLGEAAVFRNLGYDVLLVDFRGGGGSDGDDTTVGYRESLDVAAAAKYAREHFAPRTLVLYGQSMGSTAILRAIAKDGVAPDALVLECPFDRLLSTVANRFTWMHVPSFPLSQLLLFWGGVRQGYWGFAHNPVDYAPAVKCPTLLMRGADDPWVREPELRSIYDRIATRKDLVTFDHVGHGPCLEHHDEQWRDAVSAFLDDRAP